MTTAFTAKQIEDHRLGRFNVQKFTMTGTATIYIAVRVGRYTTVTLNKGASTATLKKTCDFTANTNIDDAEFSTLALSTGTDDYCEGHSAGLTGFEVDLTAYVADCEVIVTEYDLYR